MAPVVAVALGLAAFGRAETGRTMTDIETAPEPVRLTARPRAVVRGGPGGLRPLGSPEERRGWIHVPERLAADAPVPLIIGLHGAGGDARRALDGLVPAAEAVGAIALAPQSRGSTWDVIVSTFGPDVAEIDAALAEVFETYRVDPARIAISGFSDGASYALTLGLANGDLFSAVIAFSPGFSMPPSRHGKPRVFVSHGDRDPVLPIDPTSRRIVPALEARGYDVRYREFHGGHAVPDEVQREAITWLGWPRR
jgi:phospholipase/carboxylesterase